jgi:hypothetical protein
MSLIEGESCETQIDFSPPSRRTSVTLGDACRSLPKNAK